MNKPRLLDLCCGAGGAGYGYMLAGFEVHGVDNVPQRHHRGDRFILDDAVAYLRQHGSEYDAIHASPPCQKFSRMTNGRWQDRLDDHPDLITPIRELLLELGKPYVIENVPGAPLVNPILLCGTMFGRQTPEGSQLQRHRLFETSFPIDMAGMTCQHNDGSPIGVYGGGQHPDRRRPATIGIYGNAGGYSQRDNIHFYGVDARRQVMGIDWMSGKELSQAIPPCYTHWIGLFLMREVRNDGRSVRRRGLKED